MGAVKVEASGILAPGVAAGKTSVLRTKDVAFANQGRFILEIGGASVGGDGTTGYDQLEVTGRVTLDGASLELFQLANFTVLPGQLFFIIKNDGSDPVEGTFAQGNAVNFGSQVLQISYTADSDTNSLFGGNDVALALVPEPSAAMFLSVTLLGLAGRRRRRVA